MLNIRGSFGKLLLLTAYNQRLFIRTKYVCKTCLKLIRNKANNWDIQANGCLLRPPVDKPRRIWEMMNRETFYRGERRKYIKGIRFSASQILFRINVDYSFVYKYVNVYTRIRTGEHLRNGSWLLFMHIRNIIHTYVCILI